MTWPEGFEAWLAVFSLFILSCLVPARAMAYGPMVPLDRMSCRQAVAYVKKYGMYWISTEADGPIPITFVTANPNACAGEHVLNYHVRPTRDRTDCLVGYSCRD